MTREEYRTNAPARRAYMKAWRLANIARYQYHMHSSLGKTRHQVPISAWMTVDEFVNWYSEQSEQCASCGKDGKLVIDHCHKTGRPRGLICSQCNVAEGMLKTVDNAAALLRYMVSHT